MKKKFLFFCIGIMLVSLGAAAGLPAQEKTSLPFSVKTSVRNPRVNIGDSIRFRMTVRAQRDTAVELSEFSRLTDSLEIKKQHLATRTRFGRKTAFLEAVIVAHKTGEFSLPGINIRYRQAGWNDWKTYATAPVKIDVRSLLGNETQGLTIRGIKGPWTPLDKRIPAAAFGFVAVLAYLFLRGAKTVKKTVVAQPPPPAHVVALNRIRDLEKRDLISRGLVKEFFYEISLIIRHYLEDRFEVHAPEMTTEEFLPYLRDSAFLNGEQKGLVRNFLVSCDLVKFAKYNPREREIAELLHAAKRLIEETRAQTSKQ